MRKRLCILAVVVWQGLPAAGESAKDYVGAQTCQGCHPDQFAAQSRSAHAHSLYRAERHPLVDSFVTDRDLERTPEFRFRFVLDSEKLWVRAFDGQDVRDMIVEWALGAGGQG
ncbi:MAG: hypothetical protein GY953_29155, partial [bacterium]|nr:hypothetical protein [bacterium]